MYPRTPIFLRIVDSFFRHQLLFWGALLIISSLTMAALYARSKTFHASASTYVQPESIASALGQGDTNTWVTPAQKHIDRLSDLLKESQPEGFLPAALKTANLSTPIDVDPRRDDPRYIMLQKNLSLSADSANQFSINLTWDNPEETENIVRALQDQYIAEVGLDRSANSTATLKFLDGQIAKVTVNLHAAEQALSDFKASNGGQLSDAESAYSNQLAGLRSQLLEKQITLGESGRKEIILEQQLAQMKPMSIEEQTTSDQSPLQKEIAGLVVHREVVLASKGGLTPQHPDVLAVTQQINRLEALERTSASAPENQHNTQTKLQENPQYQGLKLQIAEASIAKDADQMEIQNLRQQIAQLQILVNKIPAAQRQLVDKTRAYSSTQDLYATLLKKHQDVQLTANLDGLTVTDSLRHVGVTYATPTTGKTKLIAMLAGSLLLGCLVGTILIVLSEWSDHSLRYEGDAERLLGVPVLAALPETAELRTTTRRALSGSGVPTLPAPVPEG